MRAGVVATIKDTVLYIGHKIYNLLPEEEQKTFETTERYKPDAIGEQLQMAEAAGKEWKDPFGPFEDLEDYEDFWGDDFSNTGGSVYVRELESRHFVQSSHIERRREYLEQFLDGVDGSQIRIIRDRTSGKKQKTDCLMVGWEIFKTLTGKDGTAHFKEFEVYAHSAKGLPSYPPPTLLETWDGDDFFFDKQELAEFFGVGEDLKELDAKFSASPCSRVKARIFPPKKRLTDEQKKMWMDKAKDFAGNQVKIIEVWY